MPGPSPKWHLSANHQPVGYLQVTGWCDHKKTGIPLTREAADAPWKDEHGVIREPRLWKEPGQAGPRWMSRFSKYGFVDRNNPEAAAMCDMGGEIRKRSELHKQMAWAGGKLVWNGLLACAKHRDIPNPQDRLQVLRADPVPVENPRPDLDAAHIRNTTVYPDGAAITYPNGQWIENALNEDVYRGLHLGGVDTTPPVIPPVLDDPTDFHAPLDVFVLGFNVLAPGDVVTPPGGGTDTEGLTSPDGQILLGPIDGQVLLPPT